MQKIEATEDQECITFFNWAQYNPIAREYLSHWPNGGSRHPAEAKKFKKMGVRKGVSDYFLPYPANGYHGLWIEMKKKRNSKATKEQAGWLSKMRKLGYAAKLAHGASEAIKAVQDYLMLG